MTKALKTKIICYVTSIIVNAYLVYSYATSRDIGALAQVDQYHILCDAFFLPGLIMVFLGLLMVMNNLGALDTMAYGFSYVLHMLAPGAFDKMDSYLDFIEKRRANRGSGYGFLLVVGTVMVVIAIVFLVLYYSVK